MARHPTILARSRPAGADSGRDCGQLSAVTGRGGTDRLLSRTSKPPHTRLHHFTSNAPPPHARNPCTRHEVVHSPQRPRASKPPHTRPHHSTSNAPPPHARNPCNRREVVHSPQPPRTHP